MADEQTEPKKTDMRHQGFASMAPERRAEVARKGGKTAHERGVAYKWDHEAAVAAGKKGGSGSWKGKRRRK
jgi:uncharacterized protein